MAEPYAVHITEQVAKDLDAVPSRSNRFSATIETLGDNPDRGHILHGDLFPSRSLVLSAGQGGYRAVYRVYEDLRAVMVFAVGPHGTVYDTALRRYPPPRPSE